MREFAKKCNGREVLGKKDLTYHKGHQAEVEEAMDANARNAERGNWRMRKTRMPAQQNLKGPQTKGNCLRQDVFEFAQALVG